MSITKLKKKENIRGITLIALVITIIVLLILAGVSIATLTGDNGILTKANDAKTDTTRAKAEEEIKLAVMASYNEDGKFEVNTFKEEIKKINATIVSEDENTIVVKKDEYTATIDIKTGNIISFESGEVDNKEILYLVESGVINEKIIGSWQAIPYYDREAGIITQGDGYIEYKGNDENTIYKMATLNSVNWKEYSGIRLEGTVYQILSGYEQYGAVTVGIAKGKLNYTDNWNSLNGLYLKHENPKLNEKFSVDCVLENYVENTFPFFGIHRCNIHIYNMYLYK